MSVFFVIFLFLIFGGVIFKIIARITSIFFKIVLVVLSLAFAIYVITYLLL